MNRKCNIQKKWRCSKGFTLLELMIALSLLTLIFSFLFSSFKFGRRAWEVGATLEKTASIEAVQHYLRKIIAKALPHSSVDQTKERILFNGQENQLIFVTNLSRHTQIGGYYKMKLFTKNTSGLVQSKQSLIITQTLYRSSTKKSSPRKHTRSSLLSNISALSIKYFGQKNPHERSRWHSNWSGQKTLPTLVEISIKFSQFDKRKWPQLLIATRLGKHK